MYLLDKGRPSMGSENESVYDTGDDDILETCVRTAALSNNKRDPREPRKRARNRERKSRKL